MNSSRRYVVLALVFALALPCLGASNHDASVPLDLIPLPAKLTAGAGSFVLDRGATIWARKSESDSARMVAEAVFKSCALTPRIRSGSRPAGRKGIELVLDPGLPQLGDEGYALEVTQDSVRLRAAKSAGLFYGVQTLRQLLPMPGAPGTFTCAIPCLSIEDVPRFGWRGFMLDSSRHFVKKQTVLALLDALAQVKINHFHWHLVDDNAWRLAIRKYPNLVKPVAIGGGWYTW